MTSASPTEIEACLLVVADDRRAWFEEQRSRLEIAGLPVIGFESRLLGDTYFDLAGGELAKRDCALRVRATDGASQAWRELMTFKGPASSADGLSVERLELELESSIESLEQILAHLRSIGIEISALPSDSMGTPTEILHRLGFRTIQRRQTTRVATGLGSRRAPVAELALDHVIFEVGELRIHHHEVEIEALQDTTAHEVDRIASALLQESEGALEPWPWSKTAVGRALEILSERGELARILGAVGMTRDGYARIDRLLS